MNKTENNKWSIDSKSLFSVLFFLLSLVSFSQKKIEIVNAGSLKSANNIANGAKRLIGDVQFKQDNTFMFCDSAYFYKDNSLDAFGHIRIQQGDSLTMVGEFLKYDGNTKKAIITKNVIVTKGDMQLTTDALNYDVSSSIGFYVTPAKIVNKENTLTSNTGYFFAKSNDLTFRKNVVLTNPQFVINCDTMRYNTVSKITYFKGETTIKSKENFIYCEDGWYDTFKDQSRFSKNSYIVTDEQKMFGDSLYYDRKKGVGRAIKNVQIIDSTQKITIKGDYAFYDEFDDLSIVTGNALLVQYFEKDTLYLHADTLKAIGDDKRSRIEKGKPAKVKTVAKDTIQNDNKQLFAYHRVKFYKEDIQGKCDSLYYNVNDSVMKMRGKPVLWNDENQLTADTINVVTGAKSLKKMELKNNCFIISEEDSLHYNQIRGKNMQGYFKDNKLVRVNIQGNGQTIYYAKEKNKETKKEEIKAVNRAECSDLIIYLKDNDIEKINFLNKPDATLFPIEKVDVKEFKLKNFIWRKKERPLNKEEIFN
jgi:lipopolysaccharide export system protein LptA